MKVLALNLPHADKIIRRFMCSYNSPSFLFPPQEILYCASALRQKGTANVLAVDAIAEDKDLAACLEYIDSEKPALIVTMTGIESFGSDTEMIRKIKARYPGILMVVFGYYPTIFPEKLFAGMPIDFIIRGEPEICLSGLVDMIAKGQPTKEIPGLVFRDKNGCYRDCGMPERLQDLDALPFPDPTMLSSDCYREMLINGPIALMQTSRGCPFQCNYCITTYGRKLVMRSPENVVAEIEFLVKRGFRNIRFTDDTFNVHKERVRKICQLIVDRKIKVKWTCLSRIDTLDRDTLAMMKSSGCIRVYIGVESFSQKVLDFYQKGFKASDILERVAWVKRSGMQAAGFFLIGAPVETEEDIIANIRGLREVALDFIIVSKLTPYPGTPLFERVKSDMDFNLFPYRNVFKNPVKEEDMLKTEKRLYRAFYFRWRSPGVLLRVMLSDLGAFFSAGVLFLKFLSSKKSKVERPDFL